MPSLLQLISAVESRRPKGLQPDDPILLQLEQPLLPVIACKMIEEGHLEVDNGKCNGNGSGSGNGNGSDYNDYSDYNGYNDYNDY